MTKYKEEKIIREKYLVVDNQNILLLFQYNFSKIYNNNTPLSEVRNDCLQALKKLFFFIESNNSIIPHIEESTFTIENATNKSKDNFLVDLRSTNKSDMSVLSSQSTISSTKNGVTHKKSIIPKKINKKG